MKMELLVSNPADRIERPRPEKFQGKYFSNEELNALFEAFAGTKLELAVLLGALLWTAAQRDRGAEMGCH